MWKLRVNTSRIVFVFTKNHSHLVTHIWCGCMFSVVCFLRENNTIFSREPTYLHFSGGAFRKMGICVPMHLDFNGKKAFGWTLSMGLCQATVMKNHKCCSKASIPSSTTVVYFFMWNKRGQKSTSPYSLFNLVCLECAMAEFARQPPLKKGGGLWWPFFSCCGRAWPQGAKCSTFQAFFTSGFLHVPCL